MSTCVDARVGVFCRWSEVGWLFPARLGVCLSVGARGLDACGGGVCGALWMRDRVGVLLVGVWVASRERVCLCEVFGWVWDVECVAFLEELFGLVCCDDAPDDGRPLLRVFAACGHGEELLGELWGGYWAGGVFAVWAGVAECGVLGEWSDCLGAAACFECERGGDVADGVVAEVWFACRGCLSRSVACVFPV